MHHTEREAGHVADSVWPGRDRCGGVLQPLKNWTAYPGSAGQMTGSPGRFLVTSALSPKIGQPGMEGRAFSQRNGHSNTGHNAAVKVPSFESFCILPFLFAPGSPAGFDHGLLAHLESSYETRIHLFVCPCALHIFSCFKNWIIIA
jgi:hypothetical protein